MDYFCAKGEIYNINTENNVMHYWLLTIVLLLSAFNQNEQNMVLTESVFTLICPGNNITSCQPVNYIMLVIFTSSPPAVRRNDLSWHPTWSGRFISPSPGAVIGTGQNQWRSDTELAPRCDLCVNWHKTSGRIVGLTIKRWDREGLRPHLSLSKQHQPSWVWKDRGCLFIGSMGGEGGGDGTPVTAYLLSSLLQLDRTA